MEKKIESVKISEGILILRDGGKMVKISEKLPPLTKGCVFAVYFSPHHLKCFVLFDGESYGDNVFSIDGSYGDMDFSIEESYLLGKNENFSFSYRYECVVMGEKREEFYWDRDNKILDMPDFNTLELNTLLGFRNAEISRDANGKIISISIDGKEVN